MERGRKWYQVMIDDNPDTLALTLGYAHILSNMCIYDEAIDYYERVIGMKPGWVRPLECLAYIFEYKRVLKNKAKEICAKIASVEANNRVALFVLARN